MGLRSKIHNNMGLLCFKHLEDILPVTDIHLIKLKILPIRNRSQIIHASCIGKLVHADYPIVRMCPHYVRYKIASDKASSTGYQKGPNLVIVSVCHTTPPL